MSDPIKFYDTKKLDGYFDPNTGQVYTIDNKGNRQDKHNMKEKIGDFSQIFNMNYSLSYNYDLNYNSTVFSFTGKELTYEDLRMGKRTKEGEEQATAEEFQRKAYERIDQMQKDCPTKVSGVSLYLVDANNDGVINHNDVAQVIVGNGKKGDKHRDIVYNYNFETGTFVPLIPDRA